jgi:hypothetical protein
MGPFMVVGMALYLGSAKKHLFHLCFVFMFYYSFFHILTWAMVRYRLPVDAVAIPFAALALVEIYQLGRRLRSRNRSAPVHSIPASREHAQQTG